MALRAVLKAQLVWCFKKPAWVARVLTGLGNTSFLSRNSLQEVGVFDGMKKQSIGVRHTCAPVQPYHLDLLTCLLISVSPSESGA